MSIDESRIESVQSGAEEGAGVRVVSGGTTYFAHVDGLDPADLERAAERGGVGAARRANASRERSRGVATTPQPIEVRPELEPPRARRRCCASWTSAAAPRAARSPSSRPPTPRPAARSTVANSEGLFTGDDRTRVRIGAQAVARRGDHGRDRRRDARRPPRLRAARRRPGAIAEQAARKALTLLDAGPAPAGSMPVVVGGGFGGVLFHEMTGHGLEADHIQKGASVYVGKLGEQVAQPLLTAYDDGRLPGEWGTDAIDDEGTPTQKTQVIEDGRLDRLSLRPPQRRARRGRLDRQRPPRELSPPADPAHDQHLHRPRRG